MHRIDSSNLEGSGEGGAVIVNASESIVVSGLSQVVEDDDRTKLQVYWGHDALGATTNGGDTPDGQFHWSVFRKHVENDIKIARQTKPVRRQEETWGDVIGPYPYDGAEAKDFERSYLADKKVYAEASRHAGTVVQIKTENDDFEKWWD